VTPDGPAAVIVLAAGEGTRMRTTTPKMLNEVCGRTMLGHVLAAARELSPERLILVVSDLDGQVAAYAREYCPEATLVLQERRGSWGTGHAVRTVIETVGTINGTVVVLFSDTPMLRGATLASLVEAHEFAAAAVTVLTATAPDPTGYGRILRDEAGEVTGIVEEADATDEQRQVTEISSGMFAFDGELLADAVKRVPAAAATGEEYLTEVPAILRADGQQSGPARQRPPGAQPAFARPPHGRRGDRRRPGQHLDRRQRRDRADREDLPGDPAGGGHRDRGRRHYRPWQPAARRRDWCGGIGSPVRLRGHGD
jgi:bifunctional UDP-N-acetylglucosamine pyrophosphorylase / glucosamine-1-phosphate N-acetyltransferase